MRAAVVTLVVLIAAVFVGCSMPERVIVINRSSGDLAVEFKDGKKKVIAAGQSAELSFPSFFLASAVIHNGVKKEFGWRSPPPELMDRKKYPPKFTFCLEEDGKIYAADASVGGTQPVSPQPEGFPITGRPVKEEPNQAPEPTSGLRPAAAHL
jgi:hypothetical protein